MNVQLYGIKLYAFVMKILKQNPI